MGLKNLTSVKGKGYAILIAGLLFILYSVYSMYDVYTGVQPPPSATGEIKLLSGTDLSLMANLGLWYVLMTIVASVGERIGGFGVKLIRDLKVEVKNED